MDFELSIINGKTVGEVFDAPPPFTRGCIAQAWTWQRRCLSG
jgi:hypothetical protein